jgi:hypothetical protein
MPCHAHAALCRGLEKSLSERHGRGMERARHGMCEPNTAALCTSNGKGTIYIFSGMAWQANGMGPVRERYGRRELALRGPFVFWFSYQKRFVLFCFLK